MSGNYSSPFLELLAPAKTAAMGREAILHGADAVYIGGPAFGARHHAGNLVSEIADLVAHSRTVFMRASTPPSTPSCTTLNWKWRANWFMSYTMREWMR